MGVSQVLICGDGGGSHLQIAPHFPSRTAGHIRPPRPFLNNQVTSFLDVAFYIGTFPVAADQDIFLIQFVFQDLQ